MVEDFDITSYLPTDGLSINDFSLDDLSPGNFSLDSFFPGKFCSLGE